MHLLLGRNGVKTLAAALLMFGAALRTNAEAWKDGVHAAFATGGDVRNEDFAWGYHAAYEVNDYFTVAFAATRQTDEIQDRIGQLTIPHEFNIDLELYGLSLAARLGLPLLARLELYATAGAGLYLPKTDAEEIRVWAAAHAPRTFPRTQLLNLNVDLENAFGYQAGAGIQLGLGRHWELFVEALYVALEFEGDLEVTEEYRRAPGVLPERMTRLYPDTFDYDHILIRGGFSLRF